ncbi:MAG: hypothetical protein RRZ84_07410 [Romboutsia sp.]
MKYLLIFLLALSFIGPSVEKGKTLPNVFKDGVYNYITSLDNSMNYLVENVPFFSKLALIPYENTYKRIMDDRHFTKHLVSYGESLDDIIKTYNSNIKDIHDFRKIIYKENPKVVSRDYQVQSGEYITIPSE